MKIYSLILLVVLYLGCAPKTDDKQSTDPSIPELKENGKAIDKFENGLYQRGESTECLCIDFEKNKLVSVEELQLAPPIGARTLTETKDGFIIEFSKGVFVWLMKKQMQSLKAIQKYLRNGKTIPFRRM